MSIFIVKLQNINTNTLNLFTIRVNNINVRREIGTELLNFDFSN